MSGKRDHTTLSPAAVETGPSTPSKRLALAILQDAILAIQRGVNSSSVQDRRDFHDVERWIDNAAVDWPFSFENVCATLGLDADYVRSGLRRVKQNAYCVETRGYARFALPRRRRPGNH
jgi:hypothetical protein